MALPNLRRLHDPVTAGHHRQSPTGRVPGVAADRDPPRTTGQQCAHVPPGHRLVLAHRSTPPTGTDGGPAGGDPRRHLLPNLVSADRHRQTPRPGLTMVRPREKDRLGTNPDPTTRPTHGRHRRRHRPESRPAGSVAGHPDPALLLPHLPDRAPPPHPAPTTGTGPRNPHADKSIDARPRSRSGGVLADRVRRLGNPLG